MESKITLGVIPENHKRMSSTSQLFKRIDKPIAKRQSSSGQQSRILPMKIKDHSRSVSKQNMNFETYLQKVKSAIKADEAETTSNYLLSLRKQFDKMSKDIKQQMASINIKRKQTNFLRDKINIEMKYSLGTKQRLQVLLNEVKMVGVRQQQAKMNKKTLQNMIGRIRHDQLKQKNDYILRQQKLHKKQCELRMKQGQYLVYEDNYQRLVEQMMRLQQKYLNEDKQRVMKLKDYSGYIGDLLQQERCGQEREDRRYELLSVQTNDIMDAKNVVLRDVLLVNKMLEKMLRLKIVGILGYYQNFSNSYHRIKTQTNVEDPGFLARKFFSYDEAVEELTGKIGYYERRQQELLDRNRELKQIQKQKITRKLQQQRGVLRNLQRYEEERERLIQETYESQLKCKKIKVWINNMVGRVDVGVDGEDYGEKMMRITGVVCGQSSGVSVGQKQGVFMGGVGFKRVVKEVSLDDERKRRSQLQEMNDVNGCQNDYILGERNRVKKKEFLIKSYAGKI